MPSPDLTLWIEYYRKVGFPEERADRRSAINAWVMASAWGDGKRKFTIEEFEPNYVPPVKRTDWRELKKQFEDRRKEKNGRKNISDSKP